MDDGAPSQSGPPRTESPSKLMHAPKTSPPGTPSQQPPSRDTLPSSAEASLEEGMGSPGAERQAPSGSRMTVNPGLTGERLVGPGLSSTTRQSDPVPVPGRARGGVPSPREGRRGEPVPSKGGSPGRGVQPFPVPAAKMAPEDPDAELIALLTQHIQALLEEQGREFEGGGGRPEELTPPQLFKLQQQHVKLREAATFLKLVTGARGPERGGYQPREERYQPGTRDCGVAPVSNSTGMRSNSGGVSELGSDRTVGGRPPGSDGRGSAFGSRSWPGGGIPGLYQDTWRARAEEIRAKERLFAERLRALQRRKRVEEMTADDFRELNAVWEATWPHHSAATWQPPWQPPVASGPGAASGITSEAARKSPAPSPRSGVKRPHFPDLNLPASGDGGPGKKRGVSEASVSATVFASNNAGSSATLLMGTNPSTYTQGEMGTVSWVPPASPNSTVESLRDQPSRQRSFDLNCDPR